MQRAFSQLQAATWPRVQLHHIEARGRLLASRLQAPAHQQEAPAPAGTPGRAAQRCRTPFSTLNVPLAERQRMVCAEADVAATQSRSLKMSTASEDSASAASWTTAHGSLARPIVRPAGAQYL